MLRKTMLSIIIYPAVIALFIFHFMSESESLARQGEAKVLSEIFPKVEESLPEVNRTERQILGGTPDQTTLYIIESLQEGPVVLVIGGIHGNEPAGVLAAESISTWVIDQGTLLVIPRANARAVSTVTRCALGGGDLNRSFPGTPRGSSCQKLARAIYSVMEEFRPQWVIDLHEAQEYEQVITGALGQTIIYPRNSNTLDIISRVLEYVNNMDGPSKYPFTLRRGAVPGGTICAALSLGLDGFLVETCRKEPLDTRVNQHLRAVNSLLQLIDITIY
ncbi:MAG TPA: hypothetical protein GX693_04770 [Firmicutes bacterium]|nr:hypothetical protein [Bacillota bacterium]